MIYTAVNGRSGEVVCDVPVSSGKTAAVTLIVTALIFGLLMSVLTLKPDSLLVFCGLLDLLIQYRFSGARTSLQNRKNRAFEPDFSGERRTFVGPAQALLKRKKESVAVTAAARGNHWSAALSKFLSAALFAGGLLFAFGTPALKAVSRLGSVGDNLLPVIMGVVLIIMIVHTARRTVQEKGGAWAPRVLSCLGCAAGVFMLLSAQAEDMLYYVCIAALLAAAIWELLIMNRAHNEYASRPVPFFGDGGEAANREGGL